jgi:hypothetical protein
MPPEAPGARSARRLLIRRARELGCQHLVPSDWLRIRGPRPAPARTAASAATAAATVPAPAPAPDPVQALADRTGAPLDLLRAAYISGIRDYAMLSPHSRPPLSREDVALARARSAARRHLGDGSAFCVREDRP